MKPLSVDLQVTQPRSGEARDIRQLWKDNKQHPSSSLQTTDIYFMLICMSVAGDSSALCVFSFWGPGGRSIPCVRYTHSQGREEEQEAATNHTFTAFAQTYNRSSLLRLYWPKQVSKPKVSGLGQKHTSPLENVEAECSIYWQNVTSNIYHPRTTCLQRGPSFLCTCLLAQKPPSLA